MSQYTYSIANSTANAKLYSPKLIEEVEASSIAPALDRIDTEDDSVHIIFTSGLSGTEQTTLTGVVAAHDGEPPAPITDPAEVINQPFATKKVGGKGLFARNHGTAFTMAAGANTKEFVVPYLHAKFTEIEIIGAELGDYTDLKVLDDASGTYSTVPNYVLNTFGFSVYLKPDHYKKACRYDADLYYGMRVVLEYTSMSAKDVYVNFTLHEVK